MKKPIFLEGISDVRLYHGIEPLKYVSLDNPEGDVHPFNQTFKELTDGTTPYVRSGTLQLTKLPSMSFYNTSNRL